MNRLELVKRTRKNLSDEQNTLFTHDDIVSYINESIERVGQVIPELEIMEPLNADTEEPTLSPKPTNTFYLFMQQLVAHQRISVIMKQVH